MTEAGKTQFRLLSKNKPVADGVGGLLLPDGKKARVKTDKDGYTPAYEMAGRYGVFLRMTETKSGEHGGKKYEEIRHYATLVMDVTK